MKAIIHIGGEKTGTTTIQEFGARNRDRLVRHGMLYPASLGSPNQVKLAAYALADDKIDDIRLDLALVDAQKIGVFRRTLREELAREIDACAGVTTLLMSNEHLQSRLVTLDEVKSLKELVSIFADDIKIIVYLRRQDRVAVSYYSTKLKAGLRNGDNVFPTWGDREPLPLYYDYEPMLKLYEEVFGFDRMIVRVFEPDHLLEGDLIADFCASCEIPKDWDLVETPRRNESLSEVGIQFFRRFNETVPRFIDHRPNPRWDDSIIRTMMKRFRGAGPTAPRSDAEEFYRRFGEANRAIGLRYFPEWGGRLFEEDFSIYDEARTTVPSSQDLLDVAIHLWQERTAEMAELRLENALLRCAVAVSRPGEKKLPPLPDIPLDDSISNITLLKSVGALLYGCDFQRVATVATSVLEESKGRVVFVIALGFALLRLGREDAFNDHLERYVNNKKLALSLANMKAADLATRERSEWLEFFETGDAFQSEMYVKCLGWLEH